MADFDTEVLYLETPATSAPQASYYIGVRVKNLGIAATATSGYVQVFDKDSGALVRTYAVASASMDPGEEKQALAVEHWDLSEVEVGKQFILSGLVTSPGDTVPGNDLLNPVTVSVSAAPPPPPEPVPPHSDTHEDGGTDELDVEGLHGELGDAQPYANHASKHQDGGDDELSLGAMSGQLGDPQIPTDHGNERHVEDFALVSVLTNHLNDTTPHDDALSVPFVVQAGEAPSSGAATFLSPSSHEHGGHGGLDCGIQQALVGPGPHTVLDATIAEGCLQRDDSPFDRAAVRVDVYGDVSDPGGPGSTITVDLLAGPDAPALILRQSVPIPFTAPCVAGHFRIHFLACLRGGGTFVGGHGLQCDPAGTFPVLVPISTTGSVSFILAQIWRVRLGIVGTATVDEVIASTVLETILKESGP